MFVSFILKNCRRTQIYTFVLFLVTNQCNKMKYNFFWFFTIFADFLRSITESTNHTLRNADLDYNWLTIIEKIKALAWTNYVNFSWKKFKLSFSSYKFLELFKHWFQLDLTKISWYKFFFILDIYSIKSTYYNYKIRITN